MSTHSNESNDVTMVNTSKSTQLILEDNKSERFSLRKRRGINYNLKTKKFEYDDSDSEYNEDKKKRIKAKRK
jgi:hypothetical protein